METWCDSVNRCHGRRASAASGLTQIRRMPGGKSDNRPVGLRIRKETLNLVTREDKEMTYEHIEVPLASQSGPLGAAVLSRPPEVKGGEREADPHREEQRAVAGEEFGH